ncbi:RidA family protein [Desulfoluna spongiiphila]|uniref:RidA family protein n=1 Tax=Desulfoluna spongiiphila TaxID=419481 RepID=UPI0012511E68|nr:RidA family protein [Desulfoluna spongiiphila]VVS94241.1 rida family [Desulfoluna spongiiphila]
MKKQIVCSPNAPKAIGPYSQAVIKGDTLYVSGQLPVNPETGVLAEGIENQTRQSLANIKAILETAGTDFSRVCRVGVFMTDLADFSAMNEIYATFFDGDYPARCCVQVAALPMGAEVEIEVTADV